MLPNKYLILKTSSINQQKHRCILKEYANDMSANIKNTYILKILQLDHNK